MGNLNSTEREIGTLSPELNQDINYNFGFSDALTSCIGLLSTLKTQIESAEIPQADIDVLIVQIGGMLESIASIWNDCNVHLEELIDKLEKEFDLTIDTLTQQIAIKDGKLFIKDITVDEKEMEDGKYDN